MFAMVTGSGRSCDYLELKMDPLCSHKHSNTVSMTRTHTLTGIFLGCSVLSIVLMASPITDAEPGSEDVRPKIVSVIHKCTGKQYKVTCRVKTQRDDDETIVYWLINNDFAESVYPDDSTQRVRTKTKSADHEHLATLMFKKVLPEDYSANLTCVALSSVGFDQSTTTLKKCDTKMMLKKRRECKMAE